MKKRVEQILSRIEVRGVHGRYTQLWIMIQSILYGDIQRIIGNELFVILKNLTNVALPNLIAHDLVLVHPMSSMSGYVTYLKYTTGTAKGDVPSGHELNSPFRLGDAVPNYTSARLVEEFTLSDGTGVVTASWFPVYSGDAADAKPRITAIDNSGSPVAVADDATVTVGADGKTLTLKNGASGTALASGMKVKVAYVYDNIVIPQNSLPTIKAEMDSIPLVAKARRIAVYFSQIAAFQAKTDYGFDLGDSLAEQAVGELSYEIDTEIINLLDETAGMVQPELTWSKTLPVGVSKAEHYEGFTEVVEIARQMIYDRTKKFAPNYMIISSSVLPVLTFIKGWNAAPAGTVNGPYFAGTLNSLRVYVSPALASGEYLIGVNGDDFMSSVAVYAPYMAIVPTQLLQYADGGTSQGWSTLYDLKVLNKDLIVKGKVTA